MQGTALYGQPDISHDIGYTLRKIWGIRIAVYDLNKQEPGFGDLACIWGTRQTNSKTTMETKVFGSEYANTPASKQARNIQGSQQNGRANTFLQRLSTSRKPRGQSSPKGTYNFKSNTAKSASDLQSSFSFSSRYSWKARPTFTRVWPLCRSVSLFSSSVPPTLGFSVSF